MAKVSVVIPTHNRASLLGAAIASVLSQTFQDLELVVVDDASHDDPERVARSFPDPRVRFVRHPEPRGGAAARNTGIRTTNGAYVAFLDDDDQWYPDKLTLQVELLDKSPARVGLIYAGYDVAEGSEGPTVWTRVPTRRGDLRAHLLASNPIGGTSVAVVRRECLDTVGGFDETLRSFQDYDLWLRIAERYEFDFVAKPLYRYRLHPVQIWKNPDALFAGLDRMLEKHGQHRVFREQLSGHYLNLGRRFCLAGKSGQGRRALRQALRLNPSQMRGYIYYTLTFMGSRGFEWVSGTKARLLGGTDDGLATRIQGGEWNRMT
jgi:glycosyltransferase involved in cell wall biosynthesis